MCEQHQSKRNPNLFFGIAACCGLMAGYLNIPFINLSAQVVADIFINLLKLVSLPIIFLSIVSTASGMESVKEVQTLGKKVLKYTLFTTLVSASVALALYVVVNPVRGVVETTGDILSNADQPGYLTYLKNVIPSNFVKPFLENNVISVLFLAILLSVAIIILPNENKRPLHSFFSSFYAAVMKITSWLVGLMPIAIAAFVILFMRDFHDGLEIKSLAFYLACVVMANLIQGLIVLPLFLKFKKISPINTARGMLPALSLAFFTKSSAAALPMAMRCAEENLKISRKIAGFTLPLCTTINMNGCAAFILITVLFVSMSNGISYTPIEMVTWIFVSTIAAIGNAGIPMGCYFLSTAFLAAMNVPLNLLVAILPFYTIIDMIETAINVWSDSCVAAVVDKEAKQEITNDGILLESN
ncbi:MAG TPA: dicarboxylate/amino acid:cation symporter [Parachlamydiaceae bacterium]|nr:dicarboxylate/amino acid:cation symporter [Parachlamydiaceae bacterium]